MPTPRAVWQPSIEVLSRNRELQDGMELRDAVEEGRQRVEAPHRSTLVACKLFPEAPAQELRRVVLQEEEGPSSSSRCPERMQKIRPRGPNPKILGLIWQIQLRDQTRISACCGEHQVLLVARTQQVEAEDASCKPSHRPYQQERVECPCRVECQAFLVVAAAARANSSSNSSNSPCHHSPSGRRTQECRWCHLACLVERDQGRTT
mmetsp:Transcript_19555/g.42233  ORF Transcript_19555/g.42233 Transcript_19555/m.42233 type:complete len:206 (+) Transcript_19555:398-1015(+)